MATLTSVSSSLNVSLAVAERQVQRDQSQVQEDSDRLDQSQAQLVRDQRQLSSVQEESRATRAPVTAQPNRANAILPSTVTVDPTKAQLNAQGQTIGTLINIVA